MHPQTEVIVHPRTAVTVHLETEAVSFPWLEVTVHPQTEVTPCRHMSDGFAEIRPKRALPRLLVHVRKEGRAAPTTRLVASRGEPRFVAVGRVETKGRERETGLMMWAQRWAFVRRL